MYSGHNKDLIKCLLLCHVYSGHNKDLIKHLLLSVQWSQQRSDQVPVVVLSAQWSQQRLDQAPVVVLSVQWSQQRPDQVPVVYTMVTTKTRSSACCCVPFLRLWYQPSTTISFVLLVPKNLLLCFPFSLLVVIIFACIHFLQVLCSFASRLLIQLVCPHGLLCAFWNSISVSPIAVICLLLFNSLTECKTSSFFNVGLKTFVA